MTTNKLLLCLTFCSIIVLMPRFAPAQDIAKTPSRNRGSVAAVSFAFTSTTEGTSLRPGEGEDNRYYVRVPIANNPIADPDPQVELRVERDRTDKEFLIYSFPIQSGTLPEIDFGRMILRIRFTLPSSECRDISLSAPKLSAPADVPSGIDRSATVRHRAPTETTSTAGPQPQAGIATPATNGSIKIANIDLAVSESPAFTVLGLTPQTVTRPASPRELATSLLNGVDQNCNFQSGLALDLAPYLTFAGDQLDIREYQKKYGLRLLTRLQTSFATTKGASENDKATRLALGFYATLWDRGDPRLDNELLGCFARELKVGPDDLLEPIPVDDPGPNATPEQKTAYAKYLKEKKQYDEANEAVGVENAREAEECRKASRKRNWNRSSWIIAVAPSWISPDGKTSSYQWNGGGVWSSVAYGFEGVPGLDRNAQLIFHVRYRNNEMVPDPDVEKSFLFQDSLFLGSRLRVGSANSSASFEGVFIRSRNNNQRFDNSSRFSLGVERKVAENMWFNISFGGEQGRKDGRNNGFVLTSFKWGFSEKKTPTPMTQ
jgi:hypothetical protein